MPKSGPHSLAAESRRWIRWPLSARDRNAFPIVAIGASAGGLEACKKLLHALPSPTGMAFLIVQHLDPSHDSLLVELLATQTAMNVAQATDGMTLDRDNVYLIPPGFFLSTDDKGLLRLSTPTEKHGARLPFDFLLNSLASAFGSRAVAVIMSGAGADGSLGLKAIKAKGGLVIAQDAAEADYDGMPLAAVATGAVDLVASAAGISAALILRERAETRTPGTDKSAPPSDVASVLPEVIALLRTNTSHDFTLYKHGTIGRRIERRMAMSATPNAAAYLDLLQRKRRELDELSRDLLINVTSFFRDASVFEYLAKTIIPDLLEGHTTGRPLRIWVAGCSSGEETYSLAILFREQIAASNSDVKLQIFASDVDPDAVASAREGLYPRTIEANVTAARLANYFSREDQSYRVSPDLRANVVFTVQDILADPPFARLDFISCRNLLIYLNTEAQSKAFAIFHFALRQGGLLLVGNAEAVDLTDGQFEVVSKPERLYRRIGGSRASEHAFAPSLGDGPRLRVRPGAPPSLSRQMTLANLCVKQVVESYGPAAVLINAKLECLHLQGPTDRYLKIASGRATFEIVAQAREGVRTPLRAALQGAQQSGGRFVVTDGQVKDDDEFRLFSVAVTPVSNDGEPLFLVCFLEEPSPIHAVSGATPAEALPRVGELERELEATKIDLQKALRNLEVSSEEQMAINEELLASKEELQSLNEELSALNSQLQETLERQRTTADDLQNVLYSTDTATIFLDRDFNIRFFTPATRAFFNVILGDIGRPLADLKSLAIDGDLLPDARNVLRDRATIEREIEGQSGVWFIRRILPYRTGDKRIEGVVITFENITERRKTAEALSRAKSQAEAASVAKSRFLAAASHDLRQPLQTLSLLQGLLAKRVEGEKAKKLVEGIDEALGVMTAMLNTLLNINQIDVGAIQAAPVDFPVNSLLDRLRDELTYHAEAAGLVLTVMPCAVSIHSDPRLLEQMVRNLLSNAFKYTQRGRVLVGCRRRGSALSIEIWDTGVGIPQYELGAIFEEYYQVDNAARQRKHGLGLGLSIVKRLGDLLGHPVQVRSLLGKGSVFSVEVPTTAKLPQPHVEPTADAESAPEPAVFKGSILIIEDDAEVCEHLEAFLDEEGYFAATASDGASALKWAETSVEPPDLVLADYHLPNGANGVEVSQQLRRYFNRQIPFVVLTGDTTIEALRNIATHDCVLFNKPVKLRELTLAIDKLMKQPLSLAIADHDRVVVASADLVGPTIFVVDDDDRIRGALSAVLEYEGRTVETFASCEAFLLAFNPDKPALLLVDAYLPGMSGIELLEKLRLDGHQIPAIMITGNSDVTMAVHAMRAGASDFIEKPVGRDELIRSVDRALELSADSGKATQFRDAAATRMAGLTVRQRDVMERVLAGHPNKNIAADLGISQRTVENHRASIMKRTGSRSLPALARLALIAAGGGSEPAAAETSDV